MGKLGNQIIDNLIFSIIKYQYTILVAVQFILDWYSDNFSNHIRIKYIEVFYVKEPKTKGMLTSNIHNMIRRMLVGLILIVEKKK